MQLRLGSAPDSWGVWFPSDPRQIPWPRFLDEVAAAGYRAIEIGPYGYLPTEPATLRRELAARGLTAVAGFLDGPLHEPAARATLEQRALALGELLSEVAADWLVLMTSSYADHFTGRLLGPRQLDAPAWRQLIETTEALAGLVRQRFGLRLVFHPHAGMYVETEPEIEALLAATDPTLVGLCLDTGQHVVAGGQPLTFLERHLARIPYLHLKDVDPAVLRRLQAEALPLNAAVPLGLYCEPGQGLIDFPALFEMLRRHDFAGWAIVEQDLYPTPFDRPLPIARRSLTYFTNLLDRPA